MKTPSASFKASGNSCWKTARRVVFDLGSNTAQIREPGNRCCKPRESRARCRMVREVVDHLDAAPAHLLAPGDSPETLERLAICSSEMP